MAKKENTKIEELIDEITVDCYNEDEQLSAFEVVINDAIEELFKQFINRLEKIENYSFHPDISKFAGVIPLDIDARREYYAYLEEKHK